MSSLYLLFESAAGFALFLRKDAEATAQTDDAVQEATLDAKKFAEMIDLHAWTPFKDAEEALEQVSYVSNGTPTDSLINFLEQHLPKAKKTYQLGVYDPELGKMLGDKFSIAHGQTVRELLRGCRMHFSKLCKDANELELGKARLGLGHSYSRSRMQLDPNRQDSPILNTITMLDGLDKNINTFATRVREWYTWHFPELTNIVTDNIVYAKVARTIRVRDSWKASREAELAEVCGSKQIQAEICKALRMTRGQEIAERDMQHIDHFAGEVVKLAQMQKTLRDYLKAKMDAVAPNLTALVGEIIGARLISRAGSLTTLAKYPPSTVQILGAERALFRALKNKGCVPKHGLLFRSDCVSRARKKDKGLIARFLAKKCSLASRIDCFSDKTTSVFGEKFKDQVEERLTSLNEGTEPRVNIEVPEILPEGTEPRKNLQVEEHRTSHTEGTEPRKSLEVLQEAVAEVKKGRKKLKKKSIASVADAEGAAADGDAEGRGQLPRLKKKRRKAKAGEEGAPQKKKRKAAEGREEPEEAPKKKKKKSLRRLAKRRGEAA